MQIRSLGLVVSLLLSSLSPLNASAQVLATYIGTGTNGATGDILNFKAVVSVINPGTTGSQLQILLVNNTTGTNGRGDLLSGLFFNLSGVSTTPTSGSSSGVTTSLVTPTDGGQSLVINTDNSAASSQAVNGSFAFKDLRAITSTQFQFGVNSTGFSNTGLNPNYSFSGQTLGGGGDDYTVRPNTTNAINGGAVAVIKNEVLLTLNGFGTGLTSTSQLSNIYFAVGSGAQSGGTIGATPQYVVIKGNQTPEPGSVALFMGLLVSGGLCAVRKRKTRAKQH